MMAMRIHRPNISEVQGSSKLFCLLSFDVCFILDLCSVSPFSCTLKVLFVINVILATRSKKLLGAPGIATRYLMEQA